MPAEHRGRNAPRSQRSKPFRTSGFGYFLEQATRPQTIGYALLDSPVALAAWMLDHDTDSYYKISRAFTRRPALGQPHPGPHPRQHHAVLADRHRGLGGPVVLGERTSRSPRGRAGSAAGLGPGRLHARSPARSSGPRAAGSRRPTPPSPTSTRPTGAATSPPGRSPNCSRPRSARASGRFASDRTPGRDDPGGRSGRAGPVPHPAGDIQKGTL